ncbi:Hypothetical predicted protein [Octopus vulgaris]|uniref:Uncharacterized protein n=1 Tax=Octopus vulgaris TaxID=6645 RepID=A0AA36F065_OCTVU|nr:Hypothetical predicted protein [Octopus vulgaris]
MLTALELVEFKIRVLVENTGNEVDRGKEKVDDAIINEGERKNYKNLSIGSIEELNDEDRGMIENITSIIEENLDMEINGFKKISFTDICYFSEYYPNIQTGEKLELKYLLPTAAFDYAMQ